MLGIETSCERSDFAGFAGKGSGTTRATIECLEQLMFMELLLELTELIAPAPDPSTFN